MEILVVRGISFPTSTGLLDQNTQIINQSVNQSIRQSINQSNQSINQSVSQSVSQSINHLITFYLSNNSLKKLFDENLSSFRNFKGTVDLTSSSPQLIERQVRFTTVLLNLCLIKDEDILVCLT